MKANLKSDFSFMNGAMINQPIFFNDKSLGKVISWNWDFGDGCQSSEQFTKHHFRKAGIFIVTLTVKSQYKTDVTCKKIKILKTNKAVLVNPNYHFNSMNQTSNQLNSNNLNTGNNGKRLKGRFRIETNPGLILPPLFILIAKFIHISIFKPQTNSHLYFTNTDKTNSHNTEFQNKNNSNRNNKNIRDYSPIESNYEPNQNQNDFENTPYDENWSKLNSNNWYLDDPDRRFKNSRTFFSKEIKDLDLDKIKDIIENKPRVFIQGEIDSEIAQKLSDANVKFVMKYDKLDYEKKKIKIIFVSDNSNNSKYNLLKNASNEVDNSLFIDDPLELENVLNAKAKNEKYILIFDNNKGKIFDRDINSFNFDDAITCNSFNISENNFSCLTTDLIYIKELINALKNTSTNELVYYDDFLFKLSMNYNRIIEENQYKNTLIIVGTSVTVGGGTIGLIIKYRK